MTVYSVQAAYEAIGMALNLYQLMIKQQQVVKMLGCRLYRMWVS